MSGNKSRNKGHNLERLIARDLREVVGYNKAATSRAVSKLLDDCGVDIAVLGPLVESIPYLIQAKAGYEKRRPKPDELFDYITKQLQKSFPKDHQIHSKPKVLIHELNGKNRFFTVSYKKGLQLLKSEKKLLNLKQEIVKYFLKHPKLTIPAFAKNIMDDSN